MGYGDAQNLQKDVGPTSLASREKQSIKFDTLTKSTVLLKACCQTQS
jgi:hypothetical protein